MTPAEWEVWLVNMPFDEGIGAKVRPVLVLKAVANGVLAAKMTTHLPRGNYPYEYAMVDCTGAGLNSQTTVRLSKRITLPPTDFLKKLGTVQPVDQVNIWYILKKMIAESKAL